MRGDEINIYPQVQPYPYRGTKEGGTLLAIDFCYASPDGGFFCRWRPVTSRRLVARVHGDVVFHDKQKPKQSMFLLFVYFFHPELLRKRHPGYLKLTSQILSGAHY